MFDKECMLWQRGGLQYTFRMYPGQSCRRTTCLGSAAIFLVTRAWHWGLPSTKWQICYVFALIQNVGVSCGSDCGP